ncbi:hypothetical protein [Methanococcoides burtonii]|nr:hypothetical protein [Methanococcoides burtonii]
MGLLIIKISGLVEVRKEDVYRAQIINYNKTMSEYSQIYRGRSKWLI